MNQVELFTKKDDGDADATAEAIRAGAAHTSSSQPDEKKVQKSAGQKSDEGVKATKLKPQIKTPGHAN